MDDHVSNMVPFTMATSPAQASHCRVCGVRVTVLDPERNVLYTCARLRAVRHVPTQDVYCSDDCAQENYVPEEDLRVIIQNEDVSISPRCRHAHCGREPSCLLW